MSPESPESTSRPPAAPAGWRQWLRLLAAALVVLAVSEALWIWQTWPVRELLLPHSASATGAR